MKKISLYTFSLLCSLSTFGQVKQNMSSDSSYQNWYYASREKLYTALAGTAYDVVFFGNSITEGGPWQELVGRKYKVGNRGIGGDNTFGMKARIAAVTKSKPKKIFLMMGINDLGRGLPPEWILKNYETVIQYIQRESPGTKIYIQSTLPLNESVLKYDYLMGRTKSIRDLNEGLKEIAQAYSLTYVDVKSVLAEDYILKSEFTTDGIHINTKGYLEWVNYLKDKKYL